MKLFSGFFVMILCLNAIAFQNTKPFEQYIIKNNNTPCIQAFLNTDPLNTGAFVTKKTKGIITVSKGNDKNVYFNVTLKSNIGKKGEPPVYLRFIKQKQLDIADLLEYAENGDEIFIEPYVSSLNKIDLNCTPATITVSDNL